MAKFTLRAVLPLVVAAAILWAIELLSRSALLGLDYCYELPFAGIQCSPPPGMDRYEFLAEVQYLAGLPDRVDVREDDLAGRLRAAFARHPWVQSVDEVKISTQRIEVRLQCRTPVLAVRWEGSTRAVDNSGILLPAKADTSGLPVFNGIAAPPTGPAGTRWGDKAVEAQARSAALNGGRKAH
jgi:hypothetical protein